MFSVGAVLIFHWLSSGPETPRVYRIVTDQSVVGLAPQSSVMFKGLQVGHVQDIRFDPQDGSRVIIDFRVRRNAYITQATYAVLATKGLIGGTILRLKLGQGSRKPLETSAGHPAHIPLHQGMMEKLKQAAEQYLQGLHDLLASANALLDKKNRKHLSATMRQLDTLTAKLVSLEEQLTPAIKQVPTVLTNVNKTLDTTRVLLANADKVIGQARIPVEKAGRIEDTIQDLSRKLNQQTLPDIHKLTQSLTETSRSLQELIRELKASPQSMIFGPPAPRPGPGEPGFKRH